MHRTRSSFRTTRLIYGAGHRVRVFHSAPTEGRQKALIDGVVTAPSDRAVPTLCASRANQKQ